MLVLDCNCGHKKTTIIYRALHLCIFHSLFSLADSFHGIVCECSSKLFSTHVGKVNIYVFNVGIDGYRSLVGVSVLLKCSVRRAFPVFKNEL